MAEELWLNYFNRYLLEQGVITENEYARMADLILKETRKARAKKKRKAVAITTAVGAAAFAYFTKTGRRLLLENITVSQSLAPHIRLCYNVIERS